MKLTTNQPNITVDSRARVKSGLSQLDKLYQRVFTQARTVTTGRDLPRTLFSND